MSVNNWGRYVYDIGLVEDDCYYVYMNNVDTFDHK